MDFRRRRRHQQTPEPRTEWSEALACKDSCPRAVRELCDLRPRAEAQTETRCAAVYWDPSRRWPESPIRWVWAGSAGSQRWQKPWKFRRHIPPLIARAIRHQPIGPADRLVEGSAEAVSTNFEYQKTSPLSLDPRSSFSSDVRASRSDTKLNPILYPIGCKFIGLKVSHRIVLAAPLKLSERKDLVTKICHDGCASVHEW